MTMTTTATQTAPLQVDSLLLEVTDVVNTTLDLNTILRRVAELVRRVIESEHFAILLLNEKTQEMRIRFSIGLPPEVLERCRVKMAWGRVARQPPAAARLAPPRPSATHRSW